MKTVWMCRDLIIYRCGTHGLVMAQVDSVLGHSLSWGMHSLIDPSKVRGHENGSGLSV